MATKRDYYDVLGVTKTATEAEIRSSYRKLALQWHPDRNKAADAEEKFKEINEAYQVLSDAKKKQTYDQFGHAAFEQGGPGGGNPFGGFDFGGSQSGQQGPYTYYYSSGGGNPFGGDTGGFSDPFEIFEQFFGGGNPFGRSAPKKPHYSLRIPFMTAIKGGSEAVKIDGKSHTIKIPPGSDTGTHLRFTDFDVTFEVEPHPHFKREGADVSVDLSVPFTLAALGGETTVTTLDGDLKLKIRPGTQPGTLVRLSGKGAQKVHSFRKDDRGDFYIRIIIKVPENLNRKQRQLIEELHRSL
jgi:DnaJ-class molecular chaperone